MSVTNIKTLIWTPREVSIDLSPLKLKEVSQISLFTDGVNAHRNGNDYTHQIIEASTSAQLKIKMAPGGETMRPP